MTAISKDKCAILKKILDDKWAETKSIADFKITFTIEELSQHIGTENAHSLSKLVQDDFDKIILRRCAPEGLCIKFHLDVTRRVLQVALNDDDEYIGGRLMFITGGGKLIVPKRIAGSFTSHNSFVVHGVSKHQAGLRYGLFFIKERKFTMTEND